MSRYLLIADSQQDYSLFHSMMVEVRKLISDITSGDWDATKNPKVILFTSNKCGAVAEDLKENLVDILQSNLRIPNLLKEVSPGVPATITQQDLVSDIKGSNANLIIVVSDHQKEGVIQDLIGDKKQSIIFPNPPRGVALYNMREKNLVF